MRRIHIPKPVEETIIAESKGICAFCGNPLSRLSAVRIDESGGDDPTNLIALCATCHDDHHGRRGIPLAVLRNTKKLLQTLAAVSNEAEFLNNVLKPLFEALGCTGVTVLHYTGVPERGRDLVFLDFDRLQSPSLYCVVATIRRIHADSTKTHDSGHFRKIIEQVSKSVTFPYRDSFFKSEMYPCKIVIVTPESISEEATEAFRLWEIQQQRNLVLIDGSRLVAFFPRMATARVEEST